MMKPIATTVRLITMFAVMGLVSLQLLPILGNRFNGSTSNNIVFALTNGKAITQKLNYAHFLPLTNNSKLDQVKVIVNYAPIAAGQYAFMKVYAPNGTLIKISSSPNGVNTISPGIAQFATSLSGSTIKQLTAYIMFTDSSKSANFSNPITVKLNLGQIIQPSATKSPVSIP
ncbi:MAG: hypothetical protein WCF23_24325 [Candidatus Nitrosopolaris sp.]